MPTARPFARNTGAPIAGTEQVGNLAVGFPTAGFAATGLPWWNGPDEDLGYVIATQVAANNQPTPVPENIVTSGLVLYLDAGDGSSYPGSGTTWTDLSGNNNNGTLINGPTFSSANGGSIVFDGSDDYVLLPTFTPASSLGVTINCWANFSLIPSSGASYPRLVELKDNSSWGIATNMFTFLTGPTTNEILFGNYKASPSGATFAVGPPSSAVINTWVMYTGVADSSTIKVYSNGSLLASVANVDFPGSVSMISNYIGKANDPSSAYFNGNISVVQIYNKELSDAEIAQNFNAQKSRFGL